MTLNTVAQKVNGINKRLFARIMLSVAAVAVMLFAMVHSATAATVTYECGIAEGVAGILCCDSPEYNETLAKLQLTYGAEVKLNCIRPTSPDPTNPNYFEDPLSCYLQSQGYDLGLVNCEGGGAVCYGENASSPNGTFHCPLQQGRCVQGPDVSGLGLSHDGMNAYDLAQSPQVGGAPVIAPFDLVVLDVKYGRLPDGSIDYTRCADKDTPSGGAILFKGNFAGRSISMAFFHVDPQVTPGQVLAAGQTLGVLTTGGGPKQDFINCGAYTGFGYAHIHAEIVRSEVTTLDGYNNSRIGQGDINGLMQELGCNSATQFAGCGVGRGFNAAATGQPAEALPSGSGPQCVPEGEIPELPPQRGKLTCDFDVTSNEKVDWAGASVILSAYLRAYNIDDNESRMWLGHPDLQETQGYKEAMIAKLGSVAAYEEERQERIDVTDALIKQAASHGISERFIITLWMEETAASAVGGRNLGCLYFYGAQETSQIPAGLTAGEMKVRLREQADCIDSYTSRFNTLKLFMCNYSGGVDSRPGNTCFTNGEFKNNPNFPKNICKIYDILK